MINKVRSSYFVNTNALKANNQPMSAQDYMNLGYMAGRFGVNLNNNPNEANPIIYTPQGAYVNINTCTSELFERNLQMAGIKFDRLA